MIVEKKDEFNAVKLRFKDQSELLHRLTLIDLRLFIGYLTIQMLAGSWLIANIDKIDFIVPKLGLLLIDISLTFVVLALLYQQRVRRKEVITQTDRLREF